MKLCIAGNNNIAVDIFFYSLSLLNKNEICAVLNKSDQLKNTWQKSLGFYVEKENVKIFTLDEVQKMEEITFLSAQFDKIIKPELFNTDKLFNIHFSFLPEYKGMYPSLLPILHGKRFSGVTLHKIDSGIDTGDIIDQKKINIDSCTSLELYYKYLTEGTKLVCKNFTGILNNNVQSCKQSKISSTYFSKTSFNFKELEINPFKTAFQINQFVKALNFRMYQLPKYKNIEIYKSIITDKKSYGKPGTIIFEDKQKIEITTIDYNLILYIDYFNILLDCCRTNNYIVANEIIDFIPNIDAIEKNGWNPLMIAAFNGSKEMVKLLVKKGANPNGKNLNGTTILMYAKNSFLKTKDFSIIKFLIEQGARVNAVDIYEKTVLDYIHDKELIDYLKKYND